VFNKHFSIQSSVSYNNANFNSSVSYNNENSNHHKPEDDYGFVVIRSLYDSYLIVLNAPAYAIELPSETIAGDL